MRPTSQRIALPLGLLPALCALWGCSLSTTEQTACASDEVCATAFGPRASCGADGYCNVPAVGSCAATADCRRSVGFGSSCDDGQCVDISAVPRCDARAYPEDLLESPDDHRERLVFGMLMDHGIEAHVQRENAAELAASQINAEHGIDGRQLGIIFCDVHGGDEDPYDDALSRTDAAVASAQWLVNVVELPVVIGPASSGDTTRVYTDVVRPAGGRTLEITPSGTSPSLTNLDPPATDDAPGLLWRSAPSATQQGEIIAQHMAERGQPSISNVAIIHEDAAFGQAVAAAFGELWKQDFSGSFRVFDYGAGDIAELREQVTTVGGRIDEFHAVLILGQVDEMRVFMSAATDDPNYGDDLPIYLGDTGANTEIFKDASSDRLFDNILAATVDLPDSFVNTSFNDTFIDRYDADPRDFSFTANAYDAVWLAALGAVWATYHGDGEEDAAGHREVDGTSVARGLRRTAGGEAEIHFVKTEWPSGVAQLMAGSLIDVTGASGSHEWDPVTEEAPGPTALIRIDPEGTQTIVKQIP